MSDSRIQEPTLSINYTACLIIERVAGDSATVLARWTWSVDVTVPMETGGFASLENRTSESPQTEHV